LNDVIGIVVWYFVDLFYVGLFVDVYDDGFEGVVDLVC